MTIEETRKKLKLSIEEYSDEKVQEIIDFTESLADIFLDQHKRKPVPIYKKKGSKKKISLFTKLSYNSGENKSKSINRVEPNPTLNL